MGESEKENKQSWLDSDGFLGALVVLFTIFTAFAGYLSALTGIEGDDLDFQAQRNLVLATASFQSGNSDLVALLIKSMKKPALATPLTS